MTSAFQGDVSLKQGFGVIGEVFSDSPIRSAPLTLDTGGDNYIGRAYTSGTEGFAAMGGTDVFAGYLIDPKLYASFGVAGNTLAPTLILADGTVGSFLTMGEIIVKLTTTANVGDVIVYTTADGTLQAIAPGAGLPGGSKPGYATVSRFTVGSNDLAVIMVTVTPEIPA